jgi:GNAT superfamily N-acetyltransferase
MSPPVERFRALALERCPVSDLVICEQDDPFAVSLECDFEGIGRISVEPLSEGHFSAMQEFLDLDHAGWGLSRSSLKPFESHPADTEGLAEILERVTSRIDARFVIVTAGHIIGYLVLEEVGPLLAGERTFTGDEHDAELDIGISERFQGMGLGSFAMLFYKLVAGIAGVGLGLTCSEERRGFYERHGFVRAGEKRFYSPARGQHFTSPWYRLEHNEVAPGHDDSADLPEADLGR